MTERDISWVSKEDAYQMGISTGEWMERERIIALLEAEKYGDAAALIKGED